jgi:predicted 3-demethylubiquinone-9 3-methyltransferase (glyoxalase superfamily)
LLDIIRKIIQDKSTGFEHAEANNVTELIHVIFEFYANIMNRSSRCFLFRFETTQQQTQHQRVLEQMFDFSAQVLALCYQHYDIVNAIGIFYSTIQQTLMDDFYNIENFMAEIMLSKGQLSISYVFEASSLTNTVSFDTTEYEEVMQFREIFLDLFLLLDALALKLNNELFSSKYAELLQKCVSERDFPRYVFFRCLKCCIFRISAMICYFKDLPLNLTYIDILMGLNLTWENLNFASLTDEQTIDFFENYFEYISILSAKATYEQKYAVCFL